MRRATMAAGREKVSVVDGYLSNRVFLLFSGTATLELGPAEALRLGRALLCAGLRAMLRKGDE